MLPYMLSELNEYSPDLVQAISADCAPLSRHKECPFSHSHESECKYFGTVADVASVKSLESPALNIHLKPLLSEAHCARPLCSCLTDEDLQVAFAWDLQGRDLLFDAFFVLSLMDKANASSQFDTSEIRYRAWLVQRFYMRLCELDAQSDYKMMQAVHKHAAIFSRILAVDPSAWMASTALLEGRPALEERSSSPIRRRASRRQRNLPAPGSFAIEYNEEYGTAQRALSECLQKLKEPRGEWKLIAGGNGKKDKIWQYKYKTPTNWLTFRIEGLIETSVANVLSVCTEIPHATTWVPYFKFPFRLGLRESSRKLRFGRGEHVVHLIFDCPWPLKNRDVLLETTMSNDLERQGRLNFILRGLDEDLTLPCLPMELLHPAGDDVRLSAMAGVSMIPVGKDLEHTMFQAVADLNFKENIPDTLIAFIGGTFMTTLFKHFKKVCVKAADPSSVFAESRRSDKWMFSYLEEELKNYKQFVGDVGRSSSGGFTEPPVL